MSAGSGTRAAIDAGVRKMPDPMVTPTTSPRALQKPRRLVNGSRVGAYSGMADEPTLESLQADRRIGGLCPSTTPGPALAGQGESLLGSPHSGPETSPSLRIR